MASIRPSLSRSPKATPRCRAATWKSAPAWLYILELPISQIAQNGVGFFVLAIGELSDVIQNVASGYEQILPPVIAKSTIPFPQPDMVRVTANCAGRVCSTN